jgi:hypothetical protein
MFKFAVAALLASTTLAFEYVQAYTNDLTPSSILSFPGLFMSSYSYNFDFGYKGQYDTLWPTSDLIQDVLSVKLFSNARVSLHVSVLDHYKFDVDFNFIPLEITPVKMYLNYTNPAAIVRYQTPLTAFFKATYEVKVAEFQAAWSKDLMLPKYSLFDYLFKNGPVPLPMDLVTGFGYNKDVKLWKDPNTKVNLVKTFVTDKTLTSWIGEGKYCDFDFINDEWPF